MFTPTCQKRCNLLLLLLQTDFQVKSKITQKSADPAAKRKEGAESRAGQSSCMIVCLVDSSRTLLATLSSERSYISLVLSNFFKLPVAEAKLVPTNFFSYVRSSSSTWASFLPLVQWEVVAVGILRAGRATNSYGVPDRLSSLEVLAVGVWLSEGVVRLEMVLRP